MSSPVARPIRSSSNVVTSSTESLLYLLIRVVCLSAYGSDVVDGGRLEPGRDVDAELLRSAEDLLIGVAQGDRGAVGREDLDVQAERLHLLDQHLEGLG